MSRHHHWTAREDAILEGMYPTHTASQIAQVIFGNVRAAKAIFRRACLLGLRKWPHWEPEVLERVRQLHSQGLTDASIARQMTDVLAPGDNGRRQVKHIRHDRLKLPVNIKAVKETLRQNVQKQFATLGIRTAGELRSYAYRKYARENGWPEDLRPRAVQILNLLAAVGVPLTRRQIADGIGMPWKGSRKSLTSNDPEGSYLAHLARRGLVAVLPRGHVVSGKGRGYSCHLYLLGSEALAILSQRATEEACEVP